MAFRHLALIVLVAPVEIFLFGLGLVSLTRPAGQAEEGMEPLAATADGWGFPMFALM